MSDIEKDIEESVARLNQRLEPELEEIKKADENKSDESKPDSKE